MKVIEFQEAPEEKVADEDARDVYKQVLIGPDDGAQKFHMRRFRLLPGGYTPFHSHDWEHEVFVLQGQGQLKTSDGQKDLKPGHVIYVPPADKHQFKNTGDEEFVFLCLIPAVSQT